MNVSTLIILGLWSIFYSYWALASLQVKRTDRKEQRSSRLVHLILLALAFALVGVPQFRVGPLALRFLPDTQAVLIAGIVIEALGLGLAIWARVHLGRNWSGIIAINEGHRLIRSGPYTWVRHPIYTGIATGLLGTAIAVGEWGALLGVALLTIAYLRKITQEERFLVQQFGPEYDQYRHEVKALIPFVL